MGTKGCSLKLIDLPHPNLRGPSERNSNSTTFARSLSCIFMCLDILDKPTFSQCSEVIITANSTKNYMSYRTPLQGSTSISPFLHL